MAVAVFGALFAPGVALAASPQKIFADIADNGVLDGHFSTGDLQRALHDATVSGYGNPIIVITQQQQQQGAGRPSSGRTQVFTPPSRVSGGGRSVSRSALPFTGAELATFVAIGLALIAGGVLLRLTARRTRALS